MVTTKGRTTIPGAVRKALQIKAGDRLDYQIEGDRIILRVHPGLASVRGALASNKGKDLSMTQIREAVRLARIRIGTH